VGKVADEDFALIREAFRNLDVDGTGTITQQVGRLANP
jgi:hypothetical protein